ncbi:organic solute carrier partner 1 [Musca autumnalis]|uniref:organic solute carrier partner 1 n=1 Tax=Musca autumnalis TaxID=221902 RepID=UPI003CEFB3D9
MTSSDLTTATPNMSSSAAFNPRANVFLIVNLGCEMLFVIDQRLQAQKIAKEKSIQVLHDVTSVLLEPKFLNSLIAGSTTAGGQCLTEESCKFMLKDIATCSLMRLDDVSMGKLWNLMTMIYKWQLFHTKYQYQLMDITFRHLAGVNQLYPNEKHSQIVDRAKNTLLDFWNSCTDEEQNNIYYTNKLWLEVFHTKISLLIRLGFQAMDGSFFVDVDQTYFNDFKESIGDNIYAKSSEIAQLRKQELAPMSTSASCVNQLADMLSYAPSSSTGGAAVAGVETDDFKPLHYKEFQKQFEKNLQQCNILFEDLDVNSVNATTTYNERAGGTGFVNLNATYNRQSLETSRPASSSLSSSTVPRKIQGNESFTNDF